MIPGFKWTRTAISEELQSMVLWKLQMNTSSLYLLNALITFVRKIESDLLIDILDFNHPRTLFNKINKLIRIFFFQHFPNYNDCYYHLLPIYIHAYDDI